MEKLSLKSYVWKCVLGSEIVYFACLIGGYLPFRTIAGTELHHNFFETLPGFVWGNPLSIVLGAIYAFVSRGYLVRTWFGCTIQA